MAVGRSIFHGACRDDAIRAWAVVKDDRLAETLCKLFAPAAGNDIQAGSRSEHQRDRDGFSGVFLRVTWRCAKRAASYGNRHQAACGQLSDD